MNQFTDGARDRKRDWNVKTEGLVITYRYDIYRRASNHLHIVIYTDGLVITYKYDVYKRTSNHL